MVRRVMDWVVAAFGGLALFTFARQLYGEIGAGSTNPWLSLFG